MHGREAPDIMLETRPEIPEYQIPGPKGAGVVARETAAMTTGTKTAPIAVKHAKGLLLEDLDGNVFLDFTSGMVTAATWFMATPMLSVGVCSDGGARRRT
jgi:hypothetical protein